MRTLVAGAPCSGKTTVRELFRESHGRNAVDCDDEIGRLKAELVEADDVKAERYWPRQVILGVPRHEGHVARSRPLKLGALEVRATWPSRPPVAR